MPSFEPISLTKSVSDYPVPANPSTSSGESGLHLFVQNPRVLDLPKCGCITFKFRRGPVQATEPFGGEPGRASVDLNLIEICDVKAEEVEDEGEEPGDEGDLLDIMFREAREHEIEETEKDEKREHGEEVAED